MRISNSALPCAPLHEQGCHQNPQHQFTIPNEVGFGRGAALLGAARYTNTAHRAQIGSGRTRRQAFVQSV